MIDQPLRLAIGSHRAGSGQGCAMNVISWENGDKEITDYPSCTYRPLAKLVQIANDTICKHREGRLLCAPCSIKVLKLSHMTVGSAYVEQDLKDSWWSELLDSDWGLTSFVTSTKAVTHFKRVAKLYKDRSMGVVVTRQQWRAAYAAAYADAAYAAAYAAYAAAYAYAYADAAYAAAGAAYAAAYADAAYAYAAYAAYAAKIKFIFKAIEQWERICGKATYVEPQIVESAISNMLKVN